MRANSAKAGFITYFAKWQRNSRWPSKHNALDMSKLFQKFQPLEFGKLDYLKNIIENRFFKKYKMAEQSKMSLPTTFFVFSLQFFDYSTDQKIHFGFVIWSSIQFHLFAKNDFQNGAIIQYGVFKICSTLLILLVSQIMQHSNLYFRI
jgi:hypothetical protein